MKGTASSDIAAVAQKDKGFPLAKSPPSTPHNTQLAGHHAALTAMVTC
jgi:hypothetical protein